MCITGSHILSPWVVKTLMREGREWGMFILHQKAPRASCSSFNKIYCIKYLHWKHHTHTHIYCDCIVHSTHVFPAANSMNWQLNCRSIEKGDEIVSRQACVCCCTVYFIHRFQMCKVPFWIIIINIDVWCSISLNCPSHLRICIWFTA